MRTKTRLAAAVAALVVSAGCSAGDASTPPRAEPSPPPEERIVALDWYMRWRPQFEATQVVALDPESFEQLDTLRLEDSVTQHVVDPDERLAALGGYNFGKIYLLDPATLELAGEVRVTRKRSYDEVNVVAWPEPGRLLGYVQATTAHRLLPGRAFVVDPESGEVVSKAPLRGSAMRAIATDHGAAFLVAPIEKVDHAHLVLLDENGGTRRVALRRIDAGFVDPGTPGESFLREPALVAVGDTAYVFGAGEPVAAVDLTSGTVSYHRVPGLMEERTRGETYPAMGSAGALQVRRREAVPVRGSLVLVSGHDTDVVRGGGHLREFEPVPQLVDVSRWRVRRSFENLVEVELAGRTLLGRDRDGDLVARDLRGRVLYRRPGRNRSWAVVGDRLVESGVNGRAAVLLELRSGRVVRELGELGTSLFSAFLWPPE